MTNTELVGTKRPSNPIVDKPIAGMSLSKALKYKVELAGLMKETMTRLQASNVYVEDTPPSYNSHEQLLLYVLAVDKMAVLKAAINTANAAVQEQIVKLRELKGLVSAMRMLPCSGGMVQRYNPATSGYIEVKNVVTLSELTRDVWVTSTQAAINEIQEELEEFNARTFLK